MIKCAIGLCNGELPECGELFYLCQCVVDRALLWLALMLFEIGLQLELGLIGVQQKLLSRTKRQSAKIAIGHARRDPDKSGDSHISVRHGNIMALRRKRVKSRARPADFKLQYRSAISYPNHGCTSVTGVVFGRSWMRRRKIYSRLQGLLYVG